jgi:MscS family membrane protein
VFLVLVRALGLVGMPATVLSVAGRLVLTTGIVWAAWSLTDLLASAFLNRPRATKRAFDEMLVPLLRKTAKLFIAAMGLIYVADAFGVDLLPLLASFGIAGLAISFAAQDMVKNLFGGLTIFLDQPFRLGDRIVHKGIDGNVEEIGFRITRIRTLLGHLVTVPNAGITSEPVENITRRPSIRRIMNITITYDTPRDKIEQAVQIVRDIFQEPGIREPIHQYIGTELMAPRVYFNQFNADSLNIFAIYWYIPPDWWPYNDHAQKVNFRIMEEFEKAGIEFAFPTQTLYLAGDPRRQLSVQLASDAKE